MSSERAAEHRRVGFGRNGQGIVAANLSNGVTNFVGRPLHINSFVAIRENVLANPTLKQFGKQERLREKPLLRYRNLYGYGGSSNGNYRQQLEEVRSATPTAKRNLWVPTAELRLGRRKDLGFVALVLGSDKPDEKTNVRGIAREIGAVDLSFGSRSSRPTDPEELPQAYRIDLTKIDLAGKSLEEIETMHNVLLGLSAELPKVVELERVRVIPTNN